MTRAPATLTLAFPAALPRPISGEVELAVAEIVRSGAARPVRVTQLLATVYASVAGTPTTLSSVRALASGVREWLLHRAAALFWGETGWFEAPCMACGQPMDMPARLCASPVKPAGHGFPVVDVPTSLGLRRFEVPNGAHEEMLAVSGGAAPDRRLVALCGLGADAEAEATRFTAADLAAIDAALDAAAPDVADHLSATCPACGAATEARLDPLSFAFPGHRALLREVHLLASGYGWSEADVLALPSARRRTYAGLIEQDWAGRRPRR